MEQIAEPVQDLIPSKACLARQPILNEKNQIVAYELLFRNVGASEANVIDDMAATYSVITNAFMNIGINSVLGDKKAFINIDGEFLKSDVLLLLPSDRIVLEILETVDVDSDVLLALEKLRKQNYKFALDDFVYHEDRAELINFIDIIKIDITLLNQKELIEHAKMGKKHKKQLLAEKVENLNQYELCKSLGFTLFQGYYFAKPTILTQKNIPANQLSILGIMNKLSADAENSEIVKSISHDIALSYKLLKFVNSAGSTCGQELKSIDAALNMFGYKPLYRWLSVLLFLNKDKSSENNNVLLELAIYRGRLFEIIAELQLINNSHELFILGTFSYLEVLLKQNFSKIFKDLVAPIKIKQALLEQSGSYYIYLELVAALENVDINKIEFHSECLGISVADLNIAQLSATAYCESLNV